MKTGIMSSYSPQRGFTLIEVMVVVVILSILAAVVVPRIMDNPEKPALPKLSRISVHWKVL